MRSSGCGAQARREILQASRRAPARAGAESSTASVLRMAAARAGDRPIDIGYLGWWHSTRPIGSLRRFNFRPGGRVFRTGPGAAAGAFTSKTAAECGTYALSRRSVCAALETGRLRCDWSIMIRPCPARARMPGTGRWGRGRRTWPYCAVQYCKSRRVTKWPRRRPATIAPSWRQ